MSEYLVGAGVVVAAAVAWKYRAELRALWARLKAARDSQDE